MNRIASYALALALGLSVGSTAAFAADTSTRTQSASAPSSLDQIPQQSGSPYDSNLNLGTSA
jgi:hypothetical protein